MFIVEKKAKKELGQIDVTCELISECIRQRSMKPLKLMFRKGRYGKHGCLYGSYRDYMNYMRKNGMENRKEVFIAK